MKRMLLKMICIYQAWSSTKPDGRCRFMPSCSSYAQEAIEIYGAAKGSAMAVRRICRCHPLGSFGFDPVPQPEMERRL